MFLAIAYMFTDPMITLTDMFSAWETMCAGQLRSMTWATGAMATVLGADMLTAYGANNHGSIVQIGEDWYIFYHRHTNNTWYSRQGCAEKLQIMPDGRDGDEEVGFGS